MQIRRSWIEIGAVGGRIAMSRGVLKSIQTIRFDVGLIHHKSVESPREHEAINDRKPFDEDQRALLLA